MTSPELIRIAVKAAIPSNRTYDEALTKAWERARYLWDSRTKSRAEDDDIQELGKFCTALCQGNAHAGKLLTEEALFELSVRPVS